jgi:hypothetical protein
MKIFYIVGNYVSIKKLIITNLIIFIFFLEGCNTTQKIVSTGKNTYMVSSWVPFGARPQAEFNATADANKHCLLSGKKMKLIDVTSNECMLRGGCGEAKIIFSCEDNDTSLKTNKTKSETIIKTEPKSKFSNQPININFKSITKRPDDIAVIIGNANYKKQGKDISNVNPAYADAEGIKQYFMQAKGIKEGNIIFLKDATAAQLLGTFGDSNSHKGQLYNWVKPKVSNVYVYYSGHGMPGGDKGNAYLVPTNADSQTIQFSGYALETLYSNLGKLNAKSITVILEACFSGQSQAGSLFNKSSPVIITPKKTMIPKNVKVISAGAVDQMASWEQDNSHGLFTKYFLKAMSGEGDKNNDGKVSDTELKNYLGETMTYYARRYYGRDQNVQIMQGN